MDWPPTDGQKLLEQLRARDAAFDDILIEHERREMVHRDPRKEQIAGEWRNVKFGGIPAVNPLLAVVPDPDPYDVEKVSLIKWLSRDNALAIDIRSIPDAHGQWATRIQMSNLGGLERTLVHSISGEKNLTTNFSPDNKVGQWHTYFKHTKFALGVGYSSYIQKIHRISHSGDTITLDAAMRIYEKDATRATLTLDKDLIVRSATLAIDYDGSGVPVLELMAMTDGRSPDSQTPRTAGMGQLVLVRINVIVNGEPQKVQRMVEEFQVIVRSVKRHPSDDEFRRLNGFSTSDVVTHRQIGRKL